MVMGSVVANSGITPEANRLTAGMLILSLLAFLVLKLTLFRFGFSKFQFAFHLILFPIIYFSFHILCSSKILQALKKTNLRHVVYWISGLTLEIYLVQSPWLPLLEHQKLNFNYAILLFIALAPIPVFAIILQRLTNTLLKLVAPRSFNPTPNQRATLKP